MIEVALRTLLVQTLTAMPVGPAASAVGSNVMPSTEIGKPAAAMPKVVYTLISSPRGMTDSGPMQIIRARFQLDIFAATVTAAREIADKLRKALHGKPHGTVNTLPILFVRFDDDSFDRTTPAAGANTAAARFQQDVFVTYRE